MPLPEVLVVGGGPAGVTLARALHGAADVVLVDRKDYFSITWGNPRVPAKPSFGLQNAIAYKDIPLLGTFIQAEVTSLTTSEATLGTEQTIRFDYAVVSSGCSYHDTFGNELDLSARLKGNESRHEHLRSSQSILVIGGGPVGVETAAEIAVAMPGKSVTLVSAAQRLLADKGVGMGRAAKCFLEDKGVDVQLAQKCIKGEGNSYMLTPSGEALRPDAVLMCGGNGSPNTRFLQPALAHLLDEGGYVKVDACFRAEGTSNMFAIGDVSNTPGVKLGYLATAQAHLLAANMKKAFTGGVEAGAWKAWKLNGGMSAMLVSLGPHAGTGHVACVQLPSWAVAHIKGGDLFVGKTRKEIGLPA